jgi:hypothetical protein
MGGHCPPPPISLLANGLRGLAMDLGFDGLLAANIHLDLLGLGFGLLGQGDLQQLSSRTVGSLVPLILAKLYTF